MNKDEILDKHLPHYWYTPVYPKKSRPIHDKDCLRCKIEYDIFLAMEEYAQQEVDNALHAERNKLQGRFSELSLELSKEREEHKKEIERILSSVARGEKLAETLNFDGESEVAKEREKAKKLMEALKTIRRLNLSAHGTILNGNIDKLIKQLLIEFNK